MHPICLFTGWHSDTKWQQDMDRKPLWHQMFKCLWIPKKCNYHLSTTMLSQERSSQCSSVITLRNTILTFLIRVVSLQPLGYWHEPLEHDHRNILHGMSLMSPGKDLKYKKWGGAKLSRCLVLQLFLSLLLQSYLFHFLLFINLKAFKVCYCIGCVCVFVLFILAQGCMRKHKWLSAC